MRVEKKERGKYEKGGGTPGGDRRSEEVQRREGRRGDTRKRDQQAMKALSSLSYKHTVLYVGCGLLTARLSGCS